VLRSPVYDPSVTPIALVGLPGGGKSTVGRQLARRLGCPFVDTDTLIEKKIGTSIKAYFESSGEAVFRELESEALREACAHHRGVLATGGGAVLRAENRRALKEHCTVVYLRSSPEELHRRLRHDTHRPLLQVADPLGRLRELYFQRDSLYRDAAQFVIETGRPSVNMLVSMILMQLELAGLVDADLAASPVSGALQPALGS
jgi:shikimate kinase